MRNGPSDAPPDRVTEWEPRYWRVEIDLWPGGVSGPEWKLVTGKIGKMSRDLLTYGLEWLGNPLLQWWLVKCTVANWQVYVSIFDC